MIANEQVIDFLEHHGVKGQKWGIRRLKSGGMNRHVHAIRQRNIKKIQRANNPTRQKIVQNRKRAAGASAAVGALAVTAFLSRRGTIPVAKATLASNERAAKAAREVAYNFVHDRIEKQVALNFARQIREGLIP